MWLYIANILTGWHKPIILHCPYPVCNCVFNRAVMLIYFSLIILDSCPCLPHISNTYKTLKLVWFKHGLETTTHRSPQLYHVIPHLSMHTCFYYNMTFVTQKRAHLVWILWPKVCGNPTVTPICEPFPDCCHKAQKCTLCLCCAIKIFLN